MPGIQNSFANLPGSFLQKWQNIADLLAKIVKIPAALIMKNEDEYMEVFISSNSENNPYNAGDKEKMYGLYCETVIKSQEKLHIPNALKDKNWDKNPDIELGMIAYLGIPLNFPDNQPFGTICVLDNKENKFTSENEKILYQFKNVIELDLALIQSLDLKEADNSKIIKKLFNQNEEYLSANEELKQLNNQLSAEKEKLKENEKRLIAQNEEYYSLYEEYKAQNEQIIKAKEKIEESKKALKHSHDLMQYIIEHNRSAVAVHDKNYKYIYVSKKYLQEYKVKEKNIIGKHHYEVFPDLPQKWRDVHKKALAGEVTSAEDDPYYKDDGTVEWTRWECRPWYEKDNSIGGFIVYTEVITERKELELRLKAAKEKAEESKNHWQTTFDAIEDIVLLLSSEHDIIEINKAGIEALGLPKVKITGEKCFHLIHDNSKPILECPCEISIHEKKTVKKEYTVNNKTYQLTAYPVFGENGEIKYFTHIVKDITETKIKEAKISGLSKIIENSLNEIYIFDKNTLKFKFANNGALKNTGYTAEEIKALTPVDLKPEFSLQQFKDITAPLINKETEIIRIETTHKRKNGSIYDIAISLQLAEYENEEVFVAFISDISERKKVEKENHRQKKLFETMFNTVSEGIVITNTKREILLANKGMFITFGYHPGELIGKKTKILYADVDKFEEAGKNVFNKEAEEPKKNYLTYYKNKNGKIFPGETFGTKLYDKTGKWIGNIGIMRDVTEREKYIHDLMESKAKAEESEKKLIEAQRIAKVGNWFIDIKNGRLKWSKTCYDILEIDDNVKNENLRKTLQDKIHPDDLVQLDNLNKQAIKNKEGFRFEYRALLKNGMKHILLISEPVLNNENELIATRGTIQDITEQKEAEKEKQEKEKLEKEILIAEESLRFKQNFLANMSHEIRTPLTGILGMADILSQTNLDIEQAEYLDTIRQSGKNLREIINNVLDFSKIEAGKMQLKMKVFPMENIFNNAESLFKSICKKPISFLCENDKELPNYVKADESKITQVISNLISNAVKFTEKGKIKLSTKLEHRKEKTIQIKISISDTGKGIPQHLQKKLFQPFSQVDDRDTRQFEGTGLGLSICKELAQLHRGKIGVDSSPGKGSTFWFTFTAEEASADKYLKLKEDEKFIQKPINLRILLAEDKMVNQKVIKLLLNSQGHKVTIVENGEEALNTFEPEKFDLILMDIQMPVMDGISATKALREKFTALPPIVGLSANAFEGDREKYMDKGLDEYLTKPFRIDDFIRVMDELFSISED